MAFIDQSLKLSSAQAITVTAPSTSIYDITGAGSGNAPNQIFGNATVFGADIGGGSGKTMPYGYVDVASAFTSGDAAVLSIQLQAAPDNGSNAPGTYTTIYQSGTYSVAALTAALNSRILVFPVPPIVIGEALPRFYRFNYVVTVGTFTGGTLNAGIALDLPVDAGGTLYPANYEVVTA